MPRAKATTSSRPDQTNRKLGRVVRPNAKLGFKMRLRMPHWGPDEVYDPPLLGDPAPKDFVYPEEVLKISPKGGNASNRVPFVPECPPGGTDWILGASAWLPANPGTPSEFDKWLLELLGLIRAYNRTLYELRRQHLKFENNADSMPSIGEMPDIIVGPDTPQTWIEKRFKEGARKLQKHLSAIYDKQPIIVDMIEVNGYIVSIRAVFKISQGLSFTKKDGVVRILGPQPGGSESSHIYVSSPFASH